MNARQDSAWKNLSFYRGYLPPSDRERVKEYVLLSLSSEDTAIRREGSSENTTTTSQGNVTQSPQKPPPSPKVKLSQPPLLKDTMEMLSLGNSAEQSSTTGLHAPPPPCYNPFTSTSVLPNAEGSGAAASSGGGGGSRRTTPHTLPTSPMGAAAFPSAPSTVGGHISQGNSSSSKPPREAPRRFFIIKKSALKHIPHFKSFLFKVKKCLDICTNPSPCSADCPNVHVDVRNNPDLIELDTSGVESIIVNGNAFPSTTLRVQELERTAGMLFCCGLLKHQITKAVQGTQCKFEDKCRFGSMCLFIHVKSSSRVTEDGGESVNIADVAEADTPVQAAVPMLQLEAGFLEKLQELGLATVGDIQMLSNTVFDSLVARSPPEEQWLWTQVHQIRELRERDSILPIALATFPGVDSATIGIVLNDLNMPATIDQLLALKPKHFYALKLPPKVMDACERIRQRYEPERDAYSSIDLTRLPETNFFRKVANQVVSFRINHAHKSWRKQDATRPIVTSLITYVDVNTCQCYVQAAAAGGSWSNLASPQLSAPSNNGAPSLSRTASHIGVEDAPENSWCRCRRSWEEAVNYELSTPSGSRCSEQNCLGKLASMGLSTASIREVFVHGDTHNNEDPNPLFPCGVCENMLRRVSHDVQKQYGGDVTLYMFDTVRNPKKLVCLPVQEISHREGSNFKRFIQEDLRGDPYEASTS